VGIGRVGVGRPEKLKWKKFLKRGAASVLHLKWTLNALGRGGDQQRTPRGEGQRIAGNIQTSGKGSWRRASKPLENADGKSLNLTRSVSP